MKNPISSITAESLIDDLKIGESIVFYVLPNVKVKSEENPEMYEEDILVSFVRNGVVTLANVEYKELGNMNELRPGQKLEVIRTDRYDEKGFNIIDIYVNEKRDPFWITGATFKKSKYEKVKYCFGQSILISAAPGVGKTSALAELCDSYECGELTWVEKQLLGEDAKGLKALTYRIKFGERKDDSLYSRYAEVDYTIDTDSSAPIEVQLTNLYVYITLALIDAYEGNHVVLAIDSMTRIIENLTGLYAQTHMVSGGISFDVSGMVDNLLRMGGHYKQGTLTVIGTCLLSPSNNTWKTIYTRLSAAANGEILLAKDDDDDRYSRPSTRRKEEEYQPHFTLLGEKFYY